MSATFTLKTARTFLYWISVLLLATGAMAQTVSVTLSVIDTPDSQPWSNGTYTAAFIPQAITDPNLLPATQVVTGTLNSAGGATLTLSSNAGFGGHWRFTVCPQLSATCYMAALTTVQGTSQAVALTPPSIRTFAGALVPAYANAEIPTPVIGAVYHNLVSNTERRFTPIGWVAESVADPTTMNVMDDFVGGLLTTGNIGSQAWAMAGSAACGTAAQTASALPNLGLFTVTTGASTGNTCGLTFATAGALGALGNAAGWEMVWIFKVPSNATAGAYVGASDSLTAIPSNWFGFEYDTTVDAVFHLCVSATCDATTYTADTNFHKLRAWSSTAATIQMQFDANAAISFCAAGCTDTVTPTTNALTPIAQAVTRTSSAKTLTIDYFGLRYALAR